MKRATEFITDVMGRYLDSVESCLEDIGECVGKIAEGIVKYGKHLLTGLFVIILYLFLAVAMPVWYLPYKCFKRKKRA